MFQKFNFDTEWAVRLISRITDDKDIPIEGDTIVKQVTSNFYPPPSFHLNLLDYFALNYSFH